MNTLKKFESYFEALGFIMMTICFNAGTDYEQLNNTKNILLYCFIDGNLVLWSFYFIQKFYKTFSKKRKINEK